MAFKALKMFVFGLLFILLGGFAFASKWLLPEARLPLWPFDGILAMVGGVFICYWSVRVLTGADNQDDQGTDVGSIQNDEDVRR